MSGPNVDETVTSLVAAISPYRGWTITFCGWMEPAHRLISFGLFRAHKGETPDNCAMTFECAPEQAGAIIFGDMDHPKFKNGWGIGAWDAFRKNPEARVTEAREAIRRLVARIDYAEDAPPPKANTDKR